MTRDDPIEVEVFYAYGYKGRDMFAIRAPFAMPGDQAFVGWLIRIGGRTHRVAGVARQISGPIQKGEPIGVEAPALADASGTGLAGL